MKENTNNKKKVDAFHERVHELAPDLYSRMESDGFGRNGMDVWENLYSYTIYSLCFGSHIPVDVSTRILEWVLFLDNEDHSLVILIVYMLKICEAKIMALSDKNDRFKYISHGKFIIECIQNKAYFDELVRNYLEIHVESLVNIELSFEAEEEETDSDDEDGMEFNLEHMDGTESRRNTEIENVRHGPVQHGSLEPVPQNMMHQNSAEPTLYQSQRFAGLKDRKHLND